MRALTSCTAASIAFMVFMTPAPAVAAVARVCDVSYQTASGWTTPQRREVVFHMGRELNETSRNYFSYSPFEEYAVVTFSQGNVAILEIDVAFSPLGGEFTNDDFRRLFSVPSQIEADQVNDDRKPRWRIVAKEGVPARFIDPRVDTGGLMSALPAHWRHLRKSGTVPIMGLNASGHFHAVRFYESADALATIVANFLAEGLAAGTPAVMIATHEHWTLIGEQLQARGFDLDRLQSADDLIVVDASEALASFMVDGIPHPQSFRESMVPLLERASRGRGECVVRAYGEMVDVLWREGRTVAAVKLEMLWNELARTHDFALLCGYSMGNFYKDAAIEDVCDQHTHLVGTSGAAALRQ